MKLRRLFCKFKNIKHSLGNVITLISINLHNVIYKFRKQLDHPRVHWVPVVTAVHENNNNAFIEDGGKDCNKYFKVISILSRMLIIKK